MHYNVDGTPYRPGYGLQVKIRQTQNGFHVATTRWPEECEEEADDSYLPEEMRYRAHLKRRPRQAEYVFGTASELLAWLEHQLENRGG